MKPFTFSVSINLRNDCRDTDRGQAQLLEKVTILRCMRQKLSVCSRVTDLICLMSFSVIVKEGSLNTGANNSQTLPSFKLIGQR